MAFTDFFNFKIGNFPTSTSNQFSYSTNTQLTTSNTNNFSNNQQFSDNRVVSLIFGSPNASISTKKEDSLGFNTSFTPSNQTSPSLTSSLGQTASGTGGGTSGISLTTLLIVGGIGLGALYLLK